MPLLLRVSARSVYWALGEYLTISPGATAVGTFIGEAQGGPPWGFDVRCSYAMYLLAPSAAKTAVTVTRASVQGGESPAHPSARAPCATSLPGLCATRAAVLAMNAGAMLTVASVRLNMGALSTLNSGPAYVVPVPLLSLSSFAVLGGSAVTNTVRSPEKRIWHMRASTVCLSPALQGPSVIDGDVGCWPGAADQISVSATSPPFPTLRATSLGVLQGATLSGVDWGSSPTANAAHADTLTLYASLVSRVGTPIGSALGGLTLSSGVYSSPTYMVLGAQLTLDAQGDSNAVWVFVR